MTRPPLRLYVGPDQESQVLPTGKQTSVSTSGLQLQNRVKLGQMLEVLRHAVAHDRTWLKDFMNEEIAVSEDLYDVLTTYEQLAKTADASSTGSSRAESA